MWLFYTKIAEEDLLFDFALAPLDYHLLHKIELEYHVLGDNITVRKHEYIKANKPLKV